MKCLFIVCSLIAYNLSNAQPADTVQVFHPAQLQADWDTLYTQLQSNHPALYAQWPQKEADAACKKLRKKLNRPLTRMEFDRLTRQFVSGFQDGHTYVEADFSSQDFLDYGKRGGKFFPLGVSIIEGKLYCANTAFTTAAIPLGAEIVSLNGRSAKEVINTISSLFSADDKRTSYITTQRLFGYSLWRAYGWGHQTTIEYVYNRKKQAALLEGIARADYMDLVFGKGPVRQLHLYPEYQLAVLQINSYSSAKAARAFIDSSFQVIKEKGIKHVALDLRQNGGGNSFIGDMVLTNITQKPYNGIKAKTWLNGPIMQAIPRDHWRFPSIEEARTKWGTIAPNRYHKTFEPRLLDSLAHPDLFANVKFYLLTSGRTYSSAHMTALSVKCGQLGIIIGQPTGERLDLTGEIAPFVLPHTKLSIWVPTALFTSACGIGKQVGVQPDYYVPIRVEDIKEGCDAEITFLKELIQKENKSLANQ